MPYSNRKRGSFKRKVEAVIDSRWPGRWFQNNINNDFTEAGNNKLTHTTGDVINVNTGEQVNMAHLGMLFQKDNAVMGMWKTMGSDVLGGSGNYNYVSNWTTSSILTTTSVNNRQNFGVIGYLNTYFESTKLTAFLMSYNFKMFPSKEEQPIAPTVRHITNNCNEDHLIDPMASPIETYQQFGTTTYSCMPLMEQGGMTVSYTHLTLPTNREV